LLNCRIPFLPVLGAENWEALREGLEETAVVIAHNDYLRNSGTCSSFQRLDFSGNGRLLCIGDPPGRTLPDSWNVLSLQESAEPEILLDLVCAQWREMGGEQKLSLLSAREREVVRRLCSGESFKQVAEALNVTISTVQSFKKRAMDKLNSTSFPELCRFPGIVLPASPAGRTGPESQS
jgi:DNA-binding CsgD family transcriptional regulator